jgi:membrane protease YdiL (CAAX protease family)
VSPQWAPFLAVIVVLTATVLVLARQSQSLVTAEDGSQEPAQSPKSQPPQEPQQRQQSQSQTPSDGVDDTPTETQPATPELTTGLVFANVAVTQGVVAGIVLGAAWYFSIPADALGVALRPDGATLALVAGGVGFGGLLWVANELATTLADAVGAAYDEALRELLAPDTAGGWLALYGGVLPVIALSEELLFRAALIGAPAAGYGVSPLALAVVSSGAFALGHGAQGRVGVVVTGALGLVLAGAYVVSGSLLLVVVAHYVINFLEFFIHEHLGVDDVFFR